MTNQQYQEMLEQIAQGPITVLDINQYDYLPSSFGRTFATKRAGINHCKTMGHTTLARIADGNSGVFYAPLLVPVTATLTPYPAYCEDDTPCPMGVQS